MVETRLACAFIDEIIVLLLLLPNSYYCHQYTQSSVLFYYCIVKGWEKFHVNT